MQEWLYPIVCNLECNARHLHFCARYVIRSGTAAEIFARICGIYEIEVVHEHAAGIEQIEISCTTFYSSRSFKVLARPTYVRKRPSPASFVQLKASKASGYYKFGKAHLKYSSSKEMNKRTR